MKPELNYLQLALQYEDQKAWASDENIWLLKLRDFSRDEFHQWQGVFLSHHYWAWEVHLHCTRLRNVGGQSDLTVRVFYLYADKPESRLDWQVSPVLEQDYSHWLAIETVAETLHNLNLLLKGNKT